MQGSPFISLLLGLSTLVSCHGLDVSERSHSQTADETAEEVASDETTSLIFSPKGNPLPGWTLGLDSGNNGLAILRGDTNRNTIYISGNSVAGEVIVQSTEGGSAFVLSCVKDFRLYAGDGDDFISLKGKFSGINSISLHSEAGRDTIFIGDIGDVRRSVFFD